MKDYKNHYCIVASVYFLLFIVVALSPHAIVTAFGDYPRILFFQTLVTTNLIVPFILNTLYLFFILYKSAWPEKKD